MKLSFFLNWNMLLAQGLKEILSAGTFCSALQQILPLQAGPHQGTPVCCLCPLHCGFIAQNTNIPTNKASESTHNCSLLETVQILGSCVELWSV